MKPIGKYIFLEEIVEDLKTESGVLVGGSEVDKMRYKKGKVSAIGTDVTVISEGDIIHYDSGSGYVMLIEDKPLMVISERDVVVVL